jgi:hypothetical protein
MSRFRKRSGPINAPASGDPLGRNHEHPNSSGDRQAAAKGMGKWKKITAAG